MAHKKMGQASFVEAFLRPDVGANRGWSGSSG
jgi:hypothetical protein